MIEEFERHLRGTNLSENTISSYLFALRQYSSQYDGITKKNLRAYKVCGSLGNGMMPSPNAI